MKQYIGKILIMMLLAGIFLTACSDMDDGYSLGDIWLSLGMVETENTSGYDYLLICDNGDTLLPAASDVPYFKTKQDQRVLINFTILDEVGLATNKFYVKVNNLQEILLKDLIELTPENADSLGNDSITINKIWMAKNMLNIDFSYIGGLTMHYINLAYTLDENGELKQPVELQFLHNANNDEARLIMGNIVSFRMDQLKFAGQDSTDFVVKSAGLLESAQEFTGTFRY
ncbi:MAG: NigD-like N-terminal domain-containing protein [Prolixibacteraceae bacterium]|nr:NigD-like N-terminal domain-containing protein [Prolixibacteraceae bacterium]